MQRTAIIGALERVEPDDVEQLRTFKQTPTFLIHKVLASSEQCPNLLVVVVDASSRHQSYGSLSAAY